MNRNTIAQRLLKKPPGKLIPIDLKTASYIPKGMTRAFSNNRYTVMIYDSTPTTKGNAVQVLVQNHSDTPINNHWRELQNIKNELFGKETMAIEYYPKESQLGDIHNIYWLWIFPDGIIPTKL